MASNIGSILDLEKSPDIIDWNRNHEKKFSNLLLANDRLFDALKRIGYKAAIGIAVMLTELIQMRLKGVYRNIDTDQEFGPKIESLWAAAIDPLYLKTSEFGDEYYDENNEPTPYVSNWYLMEFIMYEYTNNSFYIHRYLKNLSMLTRHLMPNQGLFDKWFAETVRKTTEIFPCSYDYADLDFDDASARYDCSCDAPVPCEFFFSPHFEYSEDTAKPVLNAFLQSLDYNNNPWLCTPEEMLEKGFKGEPYKVF